MPELYVETPLWESPAISEKIRGRALLKMEAFQPAGSFKSRGMGAACRAAYARGVRQVFCSSGGNAGLAVAYAGRQLGMQITIVVPESTGERARSLITREGAEVRVHGAAWDDAHAYAMRAAAERGAAYVHPFDDPVIWAGHSSLVHEVAAAGERPDLVVLSVGGGGLMVGVLQGMDAVGWGDIPLLAMETHGTNSLSRALAAGELVTLPAIESIAVTLGARTVCQEALDTALRHNVSSLTVSDRQALDACLAFAADHRVLVEPACGAALAAGYEALEPVAGAGTVLFVVCGGAAVTPDMLNRWDELLGE